MSRSGTFIRTIQKCLIMVQISSPPLQSNFQQTKLQGHILKYQWWRIHWEFPSFCLWSEPRTQKMSLLAICSTGCSVIGPISLSLSLLSGNLIRMKDKDKNLIWKIAILISNVTPHLAQPWWPLSPNPFQFLLQNRNYSQLHMASNHLERDYHTKTHSVDLYEWYCLLLSSY